MIRRLLMASMLIIAYSGMLQAQQEFFLDTWKPESLVIPDDTSSEPVSLPANVSITIHARDTITRIPVYMFGDNVNAYTTSMSDNKTLMKRLTDRNMGVLRGPSGSISDIYFWNRSEYQPPEDVPATLLAGASSTDWEWYGKRPNSWDAGWTMDVDSFYSILRQTGTTGLITVNYGYARYGTSDNPVAQAAHMAAEWVRYDKGRTRFWEIGNEVFGSWEAGYRIDKSLNKDGQPEYINATLYGKHCRVFIDSMKAAAAETGAVIYIGAVAAEGSGTGPADWNVNMMKEVGDMIDFYIIHSYYTPWEQNSNATVILKSPAQTQGYVNYLNTCAGKAGKPMRPVALTEYNIFAVGSNQMVSQIGGMFAAMVTGEAIKAGLGAAVRWDIANGYDNGDDHGMYSYGNEPGVALFTPRPAFYYLYYMQKYLGDVLLNTTQKGSADIAAYSSAFSSGQISTIVANTGIHTQVVRVNIDSATVGNRFYTYTLTGGADVPADPLRPFSRKVLVNGEGPEGVAGGPLNYESIKARSYPAGPEILVELPPFSVAYIVTDTGDSQLPKNDTISPSITWNNPHDIVYGTLLSATQLNAATGIPGKYVYSPQAGTKLNAGTGIELTVTFIPNDSALYTRSEKTVRINVVKSTPTIQWDTPADLVYPAPLGEDQLNAVTDVDGVFLYQPPAGTVLQPGPGHVLNTVFTPGDSLNYNTATKSVLINVIPYTGAEKITIGEVQLYPVPVTDILVISNLSVFINQGMVNMQIIAPDGSIVRNTLIQIDGDSETETLGDLPPGIYTLHLYSSDNQVIKRFVKK